VAIASINPATGEVVKTFDALSAEELQARIAKAASTFVTYRRTSFADRATWMNAAADLLDAERSDIGRTMTLEMGKTLRSAEAEAAKCAKGMRFYAEHAEAFLTGETLDDPGAVNASRAFTRYQPLGVVLAVMPWNFPLWQVVRFAAPALMAGNVGLLKHASNVPQCAMYHDDLFARAGFPDGAFQTLLISAGQVESVLRDERVAAATVTGSEPAGQSVASICGDEIKKTVLELGGSDAYVVMPSADVARAAEVAVTARCQNNGQSCIAAKRFIVHRDVYDAFLERFVAGMQALRVGDPNDDATQIGPLATETIRADVHDQVQRTVAAGARLLCGGRPNDGPGFFYPPTVLADVPADAPAAVEEVFGPVAAVLRAKDLDEAIALANATPYGLGAAAWTRDADEARRFEIELDAGCVTLNGMVASDPRLPFGGIKRSGYGRELAAIGMREFVNIKTVREPASTHAGAQSTTE
jgi:succinate-semialdehyde dehydrogenase/glutarate-semialdehyde dehydrogenase